jgi:hypothetical protein
MVEAPSIRSIPRPAPPLLPDVGEAAARRALREQIARLEGDLADLLVSSWQRARLDCRVAGSHAPHLLTLGELETLRDRLATAAAAARRTLDERGLVEEGNRRLREEMLLEPELHPFTRVTNEDVGEPGCMDWHVRPRFGLLGILMRWWRVRISSGCP